MITKYQWVHIDLHIIVWFNVDQHCAQSANKRIRTKFSYVQCAYFSYSSKTQNQNALQFQLRHNTSTCRKILTLSLAEYRQPRWYIAKMLNRIVSKIQILWWVIVVFFIILYFYPLNVKKVLGRSFHCAEVYRDRERDSSLIPMSHLSNS